MCAFCPSVIDIVTWASYMYCIIVRMREFDAKFLAGIPILVYKNTNIRIPARNFVSNSRIRTIMQYSAEVQQWRSATNNTRR